jgi:hypothetical protein
MSQANGRVRTRRETADLSTTLRSPGFPVELGGVCALNAAFLNESSTRGLVLCYVAGNPGPVEMTNLLSRRSHSVPKGRLNFRPVQIEFEKRLGSATALYATVALPFVIPAKPRDLQFRGPVLETRNTTLKQNCHLDRSVA